MPEPPSARTPPPPLEDGSLVVGVGVGAALVWVGVLAARLSMLVLMPPWPPVSADMPPPMFTPVLLPARVDVEESDPDESEPLEWELESESELDEDESEDESEPPSLSEELESPSPSEEFEPSSPCPPSE